MTESTAPSSATDAAAHHSGWFIVSQVKTHRVVFFTDDQGFVPAMEGDWYYVSHFLGELPPEMTLKNCFGWRFDGAALRHAGDPPEAGSDAALIKTNRKALHAMLRDAVNDLRKPWAPTCALGETLRAAKLAEANAWLDASAGRAAAPEMPLLQGLAAGRNITVAEAATLVVERHRATLAGLLASEALRERFAHAIDSALTPAELAAVRAQLIEHVAGARPSALPRGPHPMSPRELDAPLDAPARALEAARLRAQLRTAVNAQRRRVHDGFDDDDGLLKLKAKAAQSVLNDDAKASPASMAMLADMAKSRGIGVEDAARLVIGTVTEADRILRSTERHKDRLLARIECALSLREFQQVGHELHAFANGHAGD
jgi:hypothetical protein